MLQPYRILRQAAIRTMSVVLMAYLVITVPEQGNTSSESPHLRKADRVCKRVHIYWPPTVAIQYHIFWATVNPGPSKPVLAFSLASFTRSSLYLRFIRAFPGVGLSTHIENRHIRNSRNASSSGSYWNRIPGFNKEKTLSNCSFNMAVISTSNLAASNWFTLDILIGILGWWEREKDFHWGISDW